MTVLLCSLLGECLSSGCYDQVPRLGGSHNTQFWRLEVSDQGASAIVLP